MKRFFFVCLLAACGDDGSSVPDAGPPPTKFMYLNFEGGTLHPGAPNTANAATDTSDIVTVDTVFPPFFAQRDDRETILAGILDEAAATMAPYDIGIVRERPTSGTYAMIVFSTSSTSLGFGDTSGVSSIACSGSHTSVSLQFEPAEVTGTTAEIIHGYATQTVAEIGLPIGVPMVTTNGNCLCWQHADCVENFSAQQCTLGTATIDPAWTCGPTGEVDTATAFRQRLGAHP